MCFYLCKGSSSQYSCAGIFSYLYSYPSKQHWGRERRFLPCSSDTAPAKPWLITDLSTSAVGLIFQLAWCSTLPHVGATTRADKLQDISDTSTLHQSHKPMTQTQPARERTFDLCISDWQSMRRRVACCYCWKSLCTPSSAGMLSGEGAEVSETGLPSPSTQDVITGVAGCL